MNPDQMTPEQKRIAIAGVRGWKPLPADFSNETRREGWMLKPDGEEIGIPPNYLNDLNAMHAVEKIYLTTDALRDAMSDYLMEACDDVFPLWHATAAQRADAFLKVALNL